MDFNCIRFYTNNFSIQPFINCIHAINVIPSGKLWILFFSLSLYLLYFFIFFLLIWAFWLIRLGCAANFSNHFISIFFFMFCCFWISIYILKVFKSEFFSIWLNLFPLLLRSKKRSMGNCKFFYLKMKNFTLCRKLVFSNKIK